jgi:hypothetical protein
VCPGDGVTDSPTPAAGARGPTRAERLIGRAGLRGTRLGRAFFWASLALLGGIYVLLVPALGIRSRNGLCCATLIGMAVTPVWTGLLVTVSCALSFPGERERGTLDALRLAPIAATSLVRAMMRPRLRWGLLFLLAAAPLYLMPHSTSIATGEDLIVNVGLLSTFWRPILGYLGFVSRGNIVVDFEPTAWWSGLLAGLAALLIDATRLYALAAIATAVSVRARTAARAVFWSAFFAIVFLVAVCAAEWGGGLLSLWLTNPPGFGSRRLLVLAGLLVAQVLLLEVGIAHLLVPRKILKAVVRRAEAGWSA